MTPAQHVQEHRSTSTQLYAANERTTLYAAKEHTSLYAANEHVLSMQQMGNYLVCSSPLSASELIHAAPRKNNPFGAKVPHVVCESYVNSSFHECSLLVFVPPWCHAYCLRGMVTPYLSRLLPVCHAYVLRINAYSLRGMSTPCMSLSRSACHASPCMLLSRPAYHAYSLCVMLTSLRVIITPCADKPI